MKDMDSLAAVLTSAADLAKSSSEGFVLAVTAAYIAGVEAGKLAAHSPVPPTA